MGESREGQPELAQCPFCGGGPHETADGWRYHSEPQLEELADWAAEAFGARWRVLCYGCGPASPMVLGDSAEDAVAGWNRRSKDRVRDRGS